MDSEIKISGAASNDATIEIEGVIGVPEQWQFEEPGHRVATYEKFRQTIDAIAGIEASKITVSIRSTGGNVNDAILIHDTLRNLDATIITVCYGYVASAATIIAQAASENNRLISENALYLIHRATSAADGNAEEMSQTIDMLAKTDERIAAIYARRSGKADCVFEQMMAENNGNGRWISPREAVDAGLADRIIASAPIKNDALEIVKSLGLPKIPKNLINNNRMNSKWNSILKIIGLGKTPGQAMSESELDSIENELNARELKIESIRNEYNEELQKLQNRIDDLEAQNVRMRAKASQTKPKQDPLMGEIRRSPNAHAYEQDVQRFK